MNFKIFAGISLLAAIFFTGCQDSESVPTCPNPQTTPLPINLRIVKSNGTDLLNSNNAGAYQQSNIDISFEDRGVTVSSPATILRIASSDSFYLKTNLAYLSSGGRTFYLKLSPTDTDTIFVKNDLTKDNNGCDVYDFSGFTYNGATIARTPSQISGGYFTVVK